MSRYRGPRFKKIRRLGALARLTNKRPKAGSDLRNQSRSGKKSQYCIKKNDVFIMENDNYLNTFVSPEKPRGQQVKFDYNYLKCVWITSFFDWVWFRLFP